MLHCNKIGGPLVDINENTSAPVTPWIRAGAPGEPNACRSGTRRGDCFLLRCGTNNGGPDQKQSNNKGISVDNKRVWNFGSMDKPHEHPPAPGRTGDVPRSSLQEAPRPAGARPPRSLQIVADSPPEAQRSKGSGNEGRAPAPQLTARGSPLWRGYAPDRRHSTILMDYYIAGLTAGATKG